MTDAIVIGGGIFGCVIARALSHAGRQVIVVDDNQPEAGSKPSACLMKPSWFSGLGSRVYEPALALLDRMYRLEELQFTVWPTESRMSVLRIPTPRILNDRSLTLIRGYASAVGPGWVDVNGQRHEAPLVVVAAGVWTSALLPVPGLVGKKGVAFTWHGQWANVIKPWAPYKQIVMFTQGDGTMWGSDGAAIKPENWSEERQEQAMKRILDVAQIQGKPFTLKAMTGIRPYVPKWKPCYLVEREPGLWIATGGAKNGTIAAGWAAHRIVQATS